MVEVSNIAELPTNRMRENGKRSISNESRKRKVPSQEPKPKSQVSGVDLPHRRQLPTAAYE